MSKMFSKFRLIVLMLVSVIPFCRLDFIEDLVRGQNYPVEKYIIRTEDGYILPLHRIPATHNNRTNGKVVLLQHPLTCSASCFLMFGRGSPAYYFADAGFDVWLGNNRGTRFARQHETLNPDKNGTFWDFSWDELGRLDLPPTIDFILNKTNAKKLSYVGHSQSVTILFVLLAELPQYNDKIHVAHLMTPTTTIYPGMFVGLDNLLMPLLYQAEDIMSTSGMFEVISFTPMYRSLVLLGKRLCSPPSTQIMCRIVYAIFNGSQKFFTMDLVEAYEQHVPAGASYKQFLHYVQNALAYKFQKYDHGPEKNMMMYGRSRPPIYNMTNVRANIHMLYGTADMSTPVANIPTLNKVLGRKIATLSKFQDYGHIEFSYAHLDRVYRRIIKIDGKFD